MKLDIVEETKDGLGFKIKGRKIMESNGAYELRGSPPSTYGNVFTDKIDALRGKNTYLWRSDGFFSDMLEYPL